MKVQYAKGIVIEKLCATVTACFQYYCIQHPGDLMCIEGPLSTHPSSHTLNWAYACTT